MTDIPTLSYVTDAKQLLEELADNHDWVSVFWDKRDRRTPEISIIMDGDGQQPKAHITKEVYAALVDSGTVGEDTYSGFHARRIHDFKTPPAPEKTGPTVNEVIEDVLRALFAEHQDLPMRTAFFRGINKGNTWNPIDEDELVTDAYRTSAGYVNIHPGGGDPIITAWSSKGMSGDKVGDGTVVRAPRQGDEVDVEAMAGPVFRDELLTAVRAQLAQFAEPDA